MTKAEVMTRFEKAYRAAGGYRALAEEWGLSAAHLHDVHKGRRGLSDAILDRLGVQVERAYSQVYTVKR
jgi:hypothetical protein